MCIKREKEHEHKTRDESGNVVTHSPINTGRHIQKVRDVIYDLPLSQLIPAPAYSPTNTLRSTIGDEVLNCQVRHGSGCIHLSMSTGNFFSNLLDSVVSRLFSCCGIKPSASL